MIIIGILAVVLSESYITISRTALKIEQEKNLSEESLILTQVFQAISDEATIDYERYEEKGIKLDKNWWFTDVLYLTWGQWAWTSIYTEWENCLDLDNDFETDENYSEKIRNALEWCNLILDQWENKTTSLISKKVVTSKVMFRVIPYDSDENYFKNDKVGYLALNDVHQPAFWMFIHLYGSFYQPTWTNKVDLPLQLFFNLNL